MKIAGVDIGTTTISAVVIDTDSMTAVWKRTVKSSGFLHTGEPWARIQNAQELADSARAVLEDALNSFDGISSIGLTGQMHGIVYVDHIGKAVSPLYTWQDGCGSLPVFDGRSICDILAQDEQIPAASGYGMVTYLYHSRMGTAPQNAASFCTISDYLGMELTGRTSPLLHISQAAGMGLFDPEHTGFFREILARHGADPRLVPQVTADLTPLGTFHGIPVCVSLGDNQASFLGSVRDGTDTVSVNVGTGAQVSVLSGRPYEGHGIEARPLTRDSWLLVGAALCGGGAFAALERFFREYAAAAGAPDVPQFEVMKRLLDQQSDQTEALTVKTTFLGTRENPGAAGAISNISIANFRPAALIWGTLNGMAEELYDLYRVLEEQAGISRRRLAASGNGIRRNKALQHILSGRFGMPLTVAQNEEEAAFGAAVSACAMTASISLERWLGR